MAARFRDPLTIEHALLGFLRWRPMHGYAMYERLAEPDGLWLVWRLKRSQLYALLARLEDEALIAATREPQAEAPPRKVYRLTEAGRDAFQQWMERPVPRGRRLRMEFLAKLYFARYEEPATAERLVARQRAACRRWLKEQEDEATALPDAQRFKRLVHGFRTGQIRAMLDWLGACEDALPALTDAP